MKLIKNILMLSFLSFSFFGCNKDQTDVINTEEDPAAIDDVEEEIEIEEEEVEVEFSLEPTHVFFYVTAIIKEDGTLDCYTDPDNGPYCGVFRYYLIDINTWTGFDDYTNVCHVVHDLDPQHLVNTDQSLFTGNGDWMGWTMDASATFYGKSESCSDIPNNHKTKILVGQFANKNYSFGFGPATEDHLQSLKEQIEEWAADGEDVPDWESYYAPHIFANSIIGGGTTLWTQPNYGFAFELDTDGIPVSIDNKLQFIEMQDIDHLVHGYYRSKMWRGYPVDDYIPVSE